MFKHNRLALLAGTIFLLEVCAHIPLQLFRYYFDKNTPIQFVGLLISASIFGLVMLMRRERTAIPPIVIAVITGLIGSHFVSAFLSKNFIGSIVGDTGRHAGIAALVALIVIAIFHGQLQFGQFNKVLMLYVLAVGVTEIIALLQYFNLLTMPGIENTIMSTFGNLDFFAAFIGTSIPLAIYASLFSPKKLRPIFWGVALGGIVCVTLTGAKQGYIDVLMTAFFICVYYLWQLLKKISKNRFILPSYSPLVGTVITLVLVLVWVELIFVLPFANWNIPHVSDDPQVLIRGVMWMAALNIFRSHIFFGAGPDQFGYYYEHYRTVQSTVVLSGSSTNDAHSAPFQTLATTGLLGTLAFVALMGIVIYSLLSLLKRYPELKSGMLLLGLFLFVYFTNAAISPMTNTAKYLFWSVCGFIVGAANLHSSSQKRFSLFSKRISATFISALIVFSLFIAANYSLAQWRFIQWSEIRGPDATIQIDAKISPYIPCTVYFSRLADIVASGGNIALEKLSKDQVSINPRCLEANMKLAILANNREDLAQMRRSVYKVIELAPSRRDVLDLATIYAVRDGDLSLQKTIATQLANMGIRTIEIR